MSADEKKLDTSAQHFEHAPQYEDNVADHQRSGFSFKALFSRPDQTAFYQEALDKYGHEGAISPEAEKRLVRKLDWTIIPILGVCYLFYCKLHTLHLVSVLA